MVLSDAKSPGRTVPVIDMEREHPPNISDYSDSSVEVKAGGMKDTRIAWCIGTTLPSLNYSKLELR